MIPGDVTFWAVQILNGLVMSVLLMLITLGLTIIFGILLVVNFAHGSLYMWGAYVGMGVLSLTGQFWLALLVAPLVIAIVGIGIERTLIQPMRSQPVILTLLLTFGLTLVLDETARILWGSNPYSINAPDWLSGTIRIGSVVYPSYRIFVIGLGIAVALLLFLFLEKTDLGTVIRAASSDRETLEVMGVNTSRLFMLVFALGSALTALSGLVAAPMLTIYPAMGHNIIIDAFVVLVLGGLGSLRGTIVASFLVGQVQTLGAVVMPEFALVVVFAMMGLVLLVRPRGLLNLGRLDDGH